MHENGRVINSFKGQNIFLQKPPPSLRLILVTAPGCESKHSRSLFLIVLIAKHGRLGVRFGLKYLLSYLAIMIFGETKYLFSYFPLVVKNLLLFHRRPLYFADLSSQFPLAIGSACCYVDMRADWLILIYFRRTLRISFRYGKISPRARC